MSLWVSQDPEPRSKDLQFLPVTPANAYFSHDLLLTFWNKNNQFLEIREIITLMLRMFSPASYICFVFYCQKGISDADLYLYFYVRLWNSVRWLCFDQIGLFCMKRIYWEFFYQRILLDFAIICPLICLNYSIRDLNDRQPLYWMCLKLINGPFK